MASVIEGIPYVSVDRTEYVLHSALYRTGYQAGDKYEFSFILETISVSNRSYPMLKLAENYYLMAQSNTIKNSYIGLSYLEEDMSDGNYDCGWQPGGWGQRVRK